MTWRAVPSSCPECICSVVLSGNSQMKGIMGNVGQRKSRCNRLPFWAELLIWTQPNSCVCTHQYWRSIFLKIRAGYTGHLDVQLLGVRACTLMPLCCFRDALSDLALHFLNKMKIMVVKDIERDEIEFICKVRIQICPRSLESEILQQIELCSKY